MFTKIIVPIFITLNIFIALSFLFFQNETPTSKYPVVSLEQKKIEIAGQKLVVEVADEPHEQRQGLSGRGFLEENKGMLFIFPEPDKYGFWMKDMKFPLDLIWADENFVIIDITKNLSPETYPLILSPSTPVKYVLEINASWTDKNEIKIGDKIEL